MARRRLLTGEERRRLFDIPHDETAIVGHYTLAAEDLELVGRRYRPANRLGLATQIALMRHPGFGLQPDVDVPDADTFFPPLPADGWHTARDEWRDLTRWTPGTPTTPATAPSTQGAQ